jgi:hypothetical protein
MPETTIEHFTLTDKELFISLPLQESDADDLEYVATLDCGFTSVGKKVGV